MFGNALWQLVMSADTISKLVLFVLLVMSVVCWTIFFYKFILLRLKKQQVRDALHKVRSAHTLPDLVNYANATSKTLPGYFLTQNLALLRRVLEKHTGPAGETPAQIGKSLTQRDWDTLELGIQHSFGDIMFQEESYLSVLFISSGVATLVGLFGTVWGLIHAFTRIAEKQSADIATVAPGIAEALITTMAGLIVAIPAYVMYHYLVAENRRLEHEFSQLAERYELIIKRLVAS